MPRTPPSAADARLLDVVRARGMRVSHAQLERWRCAGLVPRNERHGLGRGRGSSSTPTGEAVAAATAMAFYARRGRAVQHAVLEWFIWAGTPLREVSNTIVVCEPPTAAVRAALRWAASRSAAGRLAAAVSGRGDEDVDRAYAIAGRLSARQAVLDPDAFVQIRRLVIDGIEPEGEDRGRVQRSRAALTHVLVARAVGYTEIGVGPLLEFLAEGGFIQAGPLDDAQLPDWADQVVADNAARIERHRQDASDQDLLQARDLARHLVAVAGIIQLLQMGAPDSAALDATTALYDQHGLGVLLRLGWGVLNGISMIPVIEGFIDPVTRAVGEHLVEALGDHPYGDIEAQMEGMIANLQAVAARADGHRFHSG